MRIQAGIRRFPGRFAGEQFRHIGFRTAFFAAVEFFRCRVAHLCRRFHMGVAARDRKLHPLIGADRLAEHDALAGIFGRALDKPAAVPDRLGSDQNALGVPPVDDVAEAFPLFADQAISRNLHIFEKQDVRMMIEHHLKRLDFQLPACLAHVNQEDRQTFGLVLQRLIRRGAGQQQHKIGLFGARDEDFLTVDDVFAAASDRACLQPRGFRSGIRFRHGKGLQPQFAARDFWQIAPLLFFAAVTKQRAHRVHLRVAGETITRRVVDLFEDDRRFHHA